MFLLIPYRTDAPVRQTPRVNYALLAANVALFFAHAIVARGQPSDPMRAYMLLPSEPMPWQFVTYMFLHGDIMHLLGNMLFLWVFGNAVNSKMGDLAYALFYLFAGVAAGIGFLVTGGDRPCLGASGAIAGVTTAYLVLFPHVDVSVFYWLFFIIGRAAIRSLWLIGLKMVLWDNLLAMRWQSSGMTNVAYEAHIAGYLVGFLMTLLLLRVGALPRDHFDLLAIIRRARQRRDFAAMMSDPNARAQSMYGRVARPVDDQGRPLEAPVARPIDPLEQKRDAVVAALASNDIDAAIARYAELTADDPQHVLPQKYQIEIANHLMARQRYPQAAAAYERYIAGYPRALDLHQVQLILGILYARHVPQFERARTFLNECAPHLTNAAQKAQAAQWLDVVTQALGGARPSEA